MKETYEILIKGHLDSSWSHTFEGITLTSQPGGDTLLQGEIADQAALLGLLDRISNYGFTLILVRKADHEHKDTLQGAEQPSP